MSNPMLNWDQECGHTEPPLVAENKRLRAELATTREALAEISEAFPDDAPHKHKETGVSLLDDVRDLLRDKRREYDRAEANWRALAKAERDTARHELEAARAELNKLCAPGMRERKEAVSDARIRLHKRD